MTDATPRPPRAPSHLSDRSRKFWRKVSSGWVLDAPAYELLRRCCEAMDRADEARQILNDEGLTFKTRYGEVRPHPAVAIERDARLAVARLLRELALDEAPEPPRPPRKGRND